MQIDETPEPTAALVPRESLPDLADAYALMQREIIVRDRELARQDDSGRNFRIVAVVGVVGALELPHLLDSAGILGLTSPDWDRLAAICLIVAMLAVLAALAYQYFTTARLRAIGAAHEALQADFTGQAEP